MNKTNSVFRWEGGRDSFSRLASNSPPPYILPQDGPTSPESAAVPENDPGPSGNDPLPKHGFLPTLLPSVRKCGNPASQMGMTHALRDRDPGDLA